MNGLQQNVETDAIANDDRSSSVGAENNLIDSTDEKSETESIQSTEMKVPKQYEDILLKPVFVKLTKYENIVKSFRTSESRAQNPEWVAK